MNKFFTICLCFAVSMAFSANKQWKCLKEDGNVAFELEAKYVYSFNNGLAPVKVAVVENNKWVYYLGFVDREGKMVITPQYEKTKGKGFVNGRAWVKKKNEDFWTLIDKTGKVIPTKKYEKVGYIHELNQGLLGVYQGDLMGFINKDGEEVIPCKYFGAATFHKGLICVSSGDGNHGYGFINMKGDWVIPMKFKQAGFASFMDNGLCRATVNGRTVLIDTAGNVIFKTTKGNIQGMWKDWVRVFTTNDRKGWGYINLQDEWVIKPQYDDLDEFNTQGMAIAEKNGLKGIIDTSGQIILPFKYETVYFTPEEDGYIMGVYPTDTPQPLTKTPKDYFTPDLKPVDMTGITYIYPANGGKLMPYQAENGKKGYLNRDFTVAVAAKFSKAEDFQEDRAWVLE